MTHLNPVDDLIQLVNTLARVVVLAGLVGSSKVPPLEAVDRAQVALFAVRKATLVQKLASAVSVPDPDSLLLQHLGICAALDEPQQLLGHSPPKDPFRGEQGEGVVAQIEAHLSSKYRQGANTCPIIPTISVVDDIPDQIQVLHFVTVLRHMVAVLLGGVFHGNSRFTDYCVFF